MATPRLGLTLLGGFQARLEPGGALTLPSRKGQALLAYLALSPRRTHSRDALAALLWGDSPDEQARASLRHALAVLRRALGPAGRSCLTTDADTVSIDPHRIDVDATAFQTLAADGDLPQLERAVSLYAGDLLAGLRISEAPFEEWLLHERERLRELAVDALARLLAKHRRAGNTEAAIQAALRLLALDPSQERVHRALIEMYVQIGRRGAAVRQYQLCADALQRELGVEPEPATQKLHQDLLASGAAAEPEVKVGSPRSDETAMPAPPPVVYQLPAPALPIIGRDAELETVRAMLLGSEVRLVTLVGPPGVGKTRLSLELARQARTAFADGAYFVELAAIRDPDLVAPAIRQTLGIARTVGPGADRAAIQDHVRHRSLLLVLDNFEQVSGAAPLVAELLAAGSGLKVLVTSRAPLHVYGEHKFTVPSLMLPDVADLPAVDQLSHVPAVALFVARARAVQPRFALTAANASEVAAICVRADGLPLAIELAAAHLGDLSLAELVTGLGQPLVLLKSEDRSRPPRQSTLHDAIEWSYSLLDPAEQRVFARLGVFAGGFDVPAARAVCGDDLAGGERLRALVDRSLVQRRPDGTRFTLLETLRAYALHRLVTHGSEADARHAHAAYFLGLSDALAARPVSAQYEMVEHIAREHDNFRGALAWLLAPSPSGPPSADDPWRGDAALRICVNLWRFWRYRCHLGEGQRWTTEALARNARSESPSALQLRGQAFWGLAQFSALLGQDALAEAQLADGLLLCERAGYTGGVATTLTAIGWLTGNRGDLDRAVDVQRRAVELCQDIGDDFRLIYALNSLCETLRGGGRHDAARSYAERSLEISQKIGHNRGRAVALTNLGAIALGANDVPRAVAAFRPALTEFLCLNDGINIATCLIGLAGTRAHAELAVPLLGFARRLLTTTDGRLEKADEQLCQQIVQHWKDGLAPADYDALWQQGSSLSLEQATGMALQESATGARRTGQRLRPLRWEHRYVTLLRATVTGPGPSDALLDAFATRARDLGGHIEELQPVALVAVFGAAGSDDAPSRAAHAAMAITHAVAEARRTSRATIDLRLALVVRPVLTARVEGGARLDLDDKRQALADLDALLVASPAGAIVTDEATARHLARRFRLERLAATAHDGRALLCIAGAEPDAVDAHAPHFVGRQHEMAALQRALRLTADGAHAVAVRGEAGIGKSRLLAELRSALDGSDVVWLEGRAVPSTARDPFVPLAMIARRACGVDATGDEDAARELAAGLERLGLERERVEPFLLLLGIGGHASALDTLTPARLAEHLHDALATLLLHVTRARPTVLVFEDIHWMDEASRRLLGVLVTRLSAAPVLMIFTARPDTVMPWLDSRRTTSLDLQPLARGESLTLLQSVLAGAPPSDAVMDDVLTRADGNPLFLQELGHQLRAAPAPAGAMPLPGTIRDVLQIKIDRLDGDSRELLDAAAVLGVEFPAALWASLVGGKVPDDDVATLERLALIAATDHTGRTFAFRHALIQETAYAMLGDERRRLLHLQAGRALEHLQDDGLGEAVDRLAYHYARSGDVDRAVEYLTRLAAQAARVNARTESVAALEEALACIEGMTDGPAQERIFLRFVVQQREALRDLADLQRSRLDLLLRQRARVDASGHDDVQRIFYLWLGRVATPLGEFELGVECAGHAARLAAARGDRTTEGAAYAVLAHAHVWLGHGAEAIACGRRAVALLEGLGDAYWLGYACRGLTLAHLSASEVKEASDTAGRLAAAAVEADSKFLAFSAIWMAAFAELYAGRSERALAGMRRALESASTPVELGQASGFIAIVHVERGEAAAAVALLAPLVSNLERLRQPHVHAFFMAYLAEAHRLDGEPARASELACRARSLAATTRYRLAYGLATRAAGRAALALGDEARARPLLEEALQVFERMPCPHEAAPVRRDLRQDPPSAI